VSHPILPRAAYSLTASGCVALEKLFQDHHARVEFIKNIIKIPRHVILGGESVCVQAK